MLNELKGYNCYQMTYKLYTKISNNWNNCWDTCLACVRIYHNFQREYLYFSNVPDRNNEMNICSYLKEAQQSTMDRGILESPHSYSKSY